MCEADLSRGINPHLIGPALTEGALVVPREAIGSGFQVGSSYGTSSTARSTLLAGSERQYNGAVFNTRGWNIIDDAFRGSIGGALLFLNGSRSSRMDSACRDVAAENSAP